MVESIDFFLNAHGKQMNEMNLFDLTKKKKEDMHKMAEANKAFAHYKW